LIRKLYIFRLHIKAGDKIMNKASKSARKSARHSLKVGEYNSRPETPEGINKRRPYPRRHIRINNTLAFCIKDTDIQRLAEENPKVAMIILEEQGRTI